MTKLIKNNYAFDDQQKAELIGTEMECPPNFRRFTITELRNWVADQDVFIIRNTTIADYDELTISDHIDLRICRGNENVYMNLIFYMASLPNDETPYRLQIWSKENHNAVKRVVNEIVKQI